MQRLKVKFIYRSMDLFVKLSILFKKIFHISPYICCFSAVIGFIDILLEENIPDDVRPICLVTFRVSFLMFLVSFFLEYIFMFLWKYPKCKGKFPWYKTTLGYLGEEDRSNSKRGCLYFCSDFNALHWANRMCSPFRNSKNPFH